MKKNEYQENCLILYKDKEITIYLKQFSYNNGPMTYRQYMKTEPSDVWEMGSYPSLEALYNSQTKEGREQWMSQLNIAYIEKTFILSKNDELFLQKLKVPKWVQ
jgi:hypothetical protein